MIEATKLQRLHDVCLSTPDDVQRFDFGHWCDLAGCGTIGCLLGHAPRAFPDDFKWGADRINGRRRSFFGLSHAQFGHLFVPRCQIYGEPKLNLDSSRQAACANLQRFINRVKTGAEGEWR